MSAASPTPEAPEGVRIVHADGTSTPVDVEYRGQEPRQVGDEIYIVDVWQITTVVSWSLGDKLAADLIPASCSIGLHRVGVR